MSTKKRVLKLSLENFIKKIALHGSNLVRVVKLRCYSLIPLQYQKAEWDTFESQQRYVDWCIEWIQEAHRNSVS